MEKFDLLLGITSFRAVPAYLPLIERLTSQFRVGVFSIDLPAGEKVKTARTDALFLSLCQKLGAKMVLNFPVETRLLILPQWHYSPEQAEAIRTRIKSRRNFLLLRLMMGSSQLDRMASIPVDKCLVVDSDLYRYRLANRPQEAILSPPEEKLIEVGLPFMKYPVFRDIELDYIIANPTPFSLPQPENRLAYLETVLALLERLSVRRSQVALKPHNAVETEDYIVRTRLLALVRKMGAGRHLLKWLLKTLRRGPLPKQAADLVCALLIACRYLDLLQRVTPLSDITPYHNLNLELFLPQVKKGLITGRSNSIWHGLYCKLPVYNCVDKDTIPENTAKMNPLSMRYFEVPFCGGKPQFDPVWWGKVREEVRERDMVAYIASVLEGQEP